MSRWLNAFWAVSVAGLVAGCSTFQDIEAGLAELKGKHISTAINRLGYPSNEQRIAGNKVYTWSTQNSGSYTMPQTNYGTGYVGTTPYNYTYTTYNTQNYNHFCTIKVIANDSDVILGSEYEGNIGGCGNYASRLAPKR